ncbi:MAG: outer membrane beta-barrel protein [Pseudomonadota bacterium]
MLLVLDRDIVGDIKVVGTGSVNCAARHLVRAILIAGGVLSVSHPSFAQSTSTNAASASLANDLRGSSALVSPVVVNNSASSQSVLETTSTTANRSTNVQTDGVVDGDVLTTGTPRFRGAGVPVAPADSANPIGSVGPPDTALAATAAGATAAPAGPTFAPEPVADPYAPQPVRIGNFNVNGEASATYGRSNNLSNSVGGAPGTFGSFGFVGGAISDWSRHQLRLASSADLDLNRGIDRNRPTDIDLEAELRLDLGNSSSVTTRATYGLSTESASSPDALITGGDNPFLTEYGLGLTYARNAGRLGLQLRGGLTAARYGDIRVSGQPAVSQNQRDRNGAQIGARLGYNGGGRVTPFVDVEYEIGRRVTPLDGNGFDRKFTGMRAAVGADVELSGKLNGSLQIGYGRRNYSDIRLPSIGGIVVNGNLDWQANDRLRVGLNLNTDFAGQSTSGVSGSIARGAGASIDWQATDALALGVNAGVTRTDYSNDERDTQYSVSATADYWLTPHAGVTASVSQTRLDTNRVGAAYNATAIELGVKLRH